jgi:hypothetical protein
MPPAAEDALTLLQKTGVNLVINTLALKLPERQQYLKENSLVKPVSEPEILPPESQDSGAPSAG